MGQKREVPDTISKPDYAFRADGISEGEQVARNINEIKVGSRMLKSRILLFFHFYLFKDSSGRVHFGKIKCRFKMIELASRIITKFLQTTRI